MTRDQIENLLTLAVYLGQSFHGHAPSRKAVYDAQRIHLHARKLSRFAEIECNREATEREIKSAARSEKLILEILKKYELRALFSGDPRGYVVKIQGLPGNTWGGDSEGFGVG
jgi:hypothetical protein